MRLTYRTINYERHQPPVDIVESELGGKYRGNAWQVHYPRHIPVPLPNPNLKYRGVAYRPEEVRSAEQTQPQPSVTAPVEATPENIIGVHTANICRVLEHRRKVAQARGDEQLLKMLELEAQQLAC
ncbi:DUF4278 domain-containing protein [Capilliphycus salinus ALCB114379]|uniref:DUF4278 domain-containing protein n=1 Tax=Capilliphycus salinus TaxID=2768948 RepID=UPI0039A6ADE4